MSKSPERDTRVLLMMADVFAGRLEGLAELKKLYNFYGTQEWCALLDLAINRALAEKILKNWKSS